MTTIPSWTAGDRLRKAREHAGLTQQQLAEAVGIGKNTVNRYEGDVVVAKRYAVAEIARETGVSLEWLLEGDQHLCARRDSNPQPSDWESRRLYGRVA